MALSKNKPEVQKNGTAENKKMSESIPQAVDIDHPYTAVFAALEKKIRNLDKKRYKAIQLKVQMNEGKVLNQDQMTTAQSLGEIESNIEIVKELTGLVSEIMIEYKKAVLKAKQDAPQPAPQNIVNPNSVKLEMHKYIMETQNSFKKLVENGENIKSLKSTEHALKPEEVDKLLSFWKIIKPADTVDSTVRIKKVVQHYIFLSNKDQRVVNDEIGVTFAQINTWLKKINTSLKAHQIQTGKKEETQAPKLEEKKVIEQPQKVAEKVIIKEKETREVTEASDGWIEIKASTASSKRRDSIKPQGDRHVNDHSYKKFTSNGSNGNAAKVNGSEETKNSSSTKITKTQIVITDLPAENIPKSTFKENRYEKNYPNNNRGFNRRFRGSEQVITDSA